MSIVFSTESFISVLAVLGGVFVVLAWLFQAVKSLYTLKVNDFSSYYLCFYLFSFFTYIAYVGYQMDYVLLVPSLIGGLFASIVVLVKFTPETTYVYRKILMPVHLRLLRSRYIRSIITK
jgi:hypothetical protein